MLQIHFMRDIVTDDSTFTTVLVPLMQPAFFGPHEIVYREGNLGFEMFCVLNGDIDIVKPGAKLEKEKVETTVKVVGGRRQSYVDIEKSDDKDVLTTLKRGSYFGEVCFQYYFLLMC
jgi:CRP-like cAMP-binding protein